MKNGKLIRKFLCNDAELMPDIIPAPLNIRTFLNSHLRIESEDETFNLKILASSSKIYSQNQHSGTNVVFSILAGLFLQSLNLKLFPMKQRMPT